MQRLAIVTVAAAALSVVLLTGCAEECPDTAPMYFNTEDGRYHYDNVGGPLVPDQDVKVGCGADQQGDTAIDVDIDKHRTAKPIKTSKPTSRVKTRR